MVQYYDKVYIDDIISSLFYCSLYHVEYCEKIQLILETSSSVSWRQGLVHVLYKV